MADYREPDVRCVDGIERMARAIYERIVYAGEDVATVLRDYLPRSAYRWERDAPPHCPSCECGGTKMAQACESEGRLHALLDKAEEAKREWSRAERAEARVAELEARLDMVNRVVADHVNDLNRCVLIFREYGLNAVADECEKAAVELHTAMQGEEQA